jgi:hypothetical protein
MPMQLGDCSPKGNPKTSANCQPQPQLASTPTAPGAISLGRGQGCSVHAAVDKLQMSMEPSRRLAVSLRS